MSGLVYREMDPGERELDWRITKSVITDKALMRTLEAAQSSGEKHAVIAMVEEGKLIEAFISPEAAVKRNYRFNAVEQALRFYNPNEGICLVIVRDGKVVVSLNGIVGNM